MRWLIWWFAVLSAYVIEFVTQTLSEVVAGAIIAALCTVIVACALRAGRPDVRVLWGWLRHLRRVPGQMLRDTVAVSGRIIWALRTGQELTGFITRVPFDYGDRENALDNGREALVIYGICATPNTVVADVDRRGELVVHQLIAGERPAESLRWPL
ncbi:MAG TPA: Na+/H+ antiporter subunit E [Candidatus Baltobacteraceae bacterium]|jgi:hypothetical protein|nr:Na+/H+ antiporter subunit E [Candidatus Baltobacteraceae bacterium]